MIAERQAARNAALAKTGRGRAKQGGDDIDPMDPVSTQGMVVVGPFPAGIYYQGYTHPPIRPTHPPLELESDRCNLLHADQSIVSNGSVTKPSGLITFAPTMMHDNHLNASGVRTLGASLLLCLLSAGLLLRCSSGWLGCWAVRPTSNTVGLRCAEAFALREARVLAC
jgi:hypothetical protein